MADNSRKFEAKFVNLVTGEVIERGSTVEAVSETLSYALRAVARMMVTAQMGRRGFITKPTMRAYLDGEMHAALDSVYSAVVDTCTVFEQLYAGDDEKMDRFMEEFERRFREQATK